MPFAKIIFVILLTLSTGTMASEQTKRIVIAASTVLDGQGRVLHNTRIVIEGSKIVAIDPKAEPVDYDLRGLTVLPGWIDAHVHITWSFGRDGKNAGAGSSTQEAAYESAANAWVTLMAGFTTVQSVGNATDIPLRDAIAKGRFPGPRILTAVEPLIGRGDQSGTPDEIRAFVRKQKEAGADLIKVFAAGGPSRPAMTLSQEQLNAACDEAKKQGLRTLVHAYKDAVRAATLAGCTQIEHGVLATDDDLKLMAAKGTYLDPQAGLVWENYLLNKERFVGTPGYPTSLEAFAGMEKADSDVPRIHSASVTNSRTENRFRHGRAGGLARRQRGRVYRSRARWRSGSDGGDGLGQLTWCGSVGHGHTDRFDRARTSSRHHCARRRSAERHHGRAAGRVCDERRRGVQEHREVTLSASVVIERSELEVTSQLHIGRRNSRL